MKKINVTLTIASKQLDIGSLEIYQSRGHEFYQFIYHNDWIHSSQNFAIDPALELAANMPYRSDKLWGVFQDISPDRWGRLVQNRLHHTFLSESDYMLGVSDFMRMGALRLSDSENPTIYLANHHEMPKLFQLRELETAARHLEAGEETTEELALIAQPGSSLGGAHPKVSIGDNGKLYIAKFQSNNDSERINLWEATALALANEVGIKTTNFQLLNHQSERPILLVERFDRLNKNRIPFMSAMTILERNETNSHDASYLELADAISYYSSQPKVDKSELWLRMTFYTLIGNIDDHLRNHAFLRNKIGWQLSPAYDINPVNFKYEKRNHQLSYDGYQTKPSLDKCIEMAEYFELNNKEINAHLQKLAKSLKKWRKIAKAHHLTAEEIKRMENAFEHHDTEKLLNCF